jgi:hypothetical protein
VSVASRVSILIPAYAAALQAAHAFAAGVDFRVADPAVGTRIREAMRGLEQEIARAGGAPVPAPL